MEINKFPKTQICYAKEKYIMQKDMEWYDDAPMFNSAKERAIAEFNQVKDSLEPDQIWEFKIWLIKQD